MSQSDQDITIDLSPLAGFDVPHIDQYFGVWAIEEHRFQAAVDHVRSLDLAAHMMRQREPQSREALASQAGRDYAVLPGGIAVVNMVGPLMKFVGSMQSGTSTIAARRAIRNAAADEAVSGILLRIDSPGGTVAGTQDLASDVAAAAKVKPVHAFIEDLGASAAFWIASQASRISANSTSLVGSIGTFAVVEDSSVEAAASGIKVHVVRAGEFKGSGVPGTPVSEAYLAELQRVVNELNQHFLDGVARGRKLSAAAVRQLADGRVHVGEAAQAVGLIDAVGSFDQAVADLRKSLKPNSGARSAMPEPNTPSVATYSQILGACPGISQSADSQFIVDQLAKGVTAEQAGHAWVETLRARIDILEQENAELRAVAALAAQPKSGVKPIPTAGTAHPAAESTATEEFNSAVAQHMAAGMTKQAAFMKVCAAQPELRARMVEESNLAAKASRRDRE